MTEYRIHPRPAVDAVSRKIEVGIVVGKGERVRFAELSERDAWTLALGLLEALKDGAA